MESIRWNNFKAVIDGINDNTAVLLQTDKYGDINTTYTTTIAIMWLNSCQNPFTPQDEAKCDIQSSTDGKLVVKSQYMNCMQVKTNWYWEQPPQQNSIISPTRTIVHPCLDVTTITKVKKPKHLWNKNQTHKYIQRSICFLALFPLGLPFVFPVKFSLKIIVDPCSL